MVKPVLERRGVCPSRRRHREQADQLRHRPNSNAEEAAAAKRCYVESNELLCIMNQSSATQGNSRDLRASQIKSFLVEALAGGEMTVIALQEKARAAGLLGERLTITDSKSFRSAKAALGVRSHRIGFGRGAIWFWVLPAPPASEGATSVTLPVDVYEFAPSDRAPETSPCHAESLYGRPHDTPIEWIRGQRQFFSLRLSHARIRFFLAAPGRRIRLWRFSPASVHALHLTCEQRCQIYALLQSGQSPKCNGAA
jgi:hypothetical protein